jgi:hypothetical protein
VPKIMPAQRFELSGYYGLLEGGRVAVVDGRSVILKYAIAGRV